MLLETCLGGVAGHSFSMRKLGGTRSLTIAALHGDVRITSSAENVFELQLIETKWDPKRWRIKRDPNSV